MTPGDVLMLTPWLDPRAGGLCSIAHDILKAVVQGGRSVILLLPSRETLGPAGFHATVVPAGPAYDWQTAADSLKPFHDLRELALADQLGLLPHTAPNRLSRVRAIHAQVDDLASNPHPRFTYQALASLVHARAGVRPILIRSHHHAFEHCLEIVMSLSGLDYVALPDLQKRAILDGRLDLAPLVHRHVHANRQSLRETRWSLEILDNPIAHVAFHLQVLRNWRAELRLLDAVVSATEREAREREAQLLPDHPGASRFIPYASSFQPPPPPILRDRLRAFRDPGLLCRRGSSDQSERVRLSPDDRIVLFVGRPVREKGVYELADALRRLYHEPRNIKGVYVGDFDAGIRASLATLDPAHASQYQLFTGHVSDLETLASLYARADVLVLPSYFDAFALVGLEGLLMGTPFLVSEATSAADAYIDHPAREGVQTALPIARPHPNDHRRYTGASVESLTHQIARILDDEPLASRLAANGADFVRRHYNQPNMSQAYLRLYNDLLAAPPPQPQVNFP